MIADFAMAQRYIFVAPFPAGLLTGDVRVVATASLMRGLTTNLKRHVWGFLEIRTIAEI